ncbi:MAG: multiple sugar transport system permease protein [Microbacteriaceae bacterium]|jgi:ABC-type sugar transport system permease subunit|nr:multiple sugar transport system permease protein [Microbacteriaceae bacterium]
MNQVIASGQPGKGLGASRTLAPGLPKGETAAPGSGAAPARRKRRRNDHSHTSVGVALLWLGPVLILIFGVVIYPAIALLVASFGTFSITGLYRSFAGFTNYVNLLASPDLSQVMWNTFVWVAAVVILTNLIALGLAQFLSKDFFGRRFVRWAVIIPWAAALVMTSQLFRLMFDYYHGIINQMLLAVHIISKPVDWLGSTTFIMPTMIAVGIFVTLPFTAYLFVAGLNAIPTDVYEAARIDGASPWQTYRAITLPLLRPAILIAVVLNMIYVFNSFPLIYIMNGSNPGYGNDTMITYMYKVAFQGATHDVGMSAATGIFNVIVILIAVGIYLRFTNWRQGGEQE